VTTFVFRPSLIAVLVNCWSP